MVERSSGSAIPTARRPDGGSEPETKAGPNEGRGAGTKASVAGRPTERPAGRRSRLTWDIPWLGGRSTAPWVVLATVLILVVATVGALYAKQKPDRLGWTTKTAAIQSDSSVAFSFSVYKSPKAVAACDIVAADHDGGVGSLPDVIVPARTDGSETTDLTVSVPTSRRADTAILEGCRIVSAG
jgi:uncharacterized protein DUF4307